MSRRTRIWVSCTSLILFGILFAGGIIVITGAAPALAVDSTFAQPIAVSAAMTIPADAPMKDLVQQGLEFAGPFPAGWQVYDAVSPTTGLDYTWSTTTMTSAQGARSAGAVLGGRNGSSLTPTATYSGSVDSWMVFPVDLSSVWQARLGFSYLKPAVTGSLTVAVSTDYDPVALTGTFIGAALPQAPTWATRTLDLSAYAGKQAYIAFRFQTPGGGRATDGPFVDDIRVQANYRIMLPILYKSTLVLSKVASAYAIQPGGSLVYTLTIRNNDQVSGPTSNLTLNDTLPAGTTFVSADDGGVYNSATGRVIWSGLAVAPGTSVNLHLTVNVPGNTAEGAKIVNKDYEILSAGNAAVYTGAPVTTTVGTDYSDDFSDPSSGWPIHDYDPALSDCPPPGPYTAHYLADGTYGVATACAWNGVVYPSPARIANTTNFTVEADMRQNNSWEWYSSYGIYFNASDDLHQFYTARIFLGEDPPEFEVNRWDNFLGSANDEQVWLAHARCPTCDGEGWNRMAVRRNGQFFDVYMGAVGGTLMRVAHIQDGTYTDSAHAGTGFYQGNFEWSAMFPAHTYLFDNFRLVPGYRYR